MGMITLSLLSWSAAVLGRRLFRNTSPFDSFGFGTLTIISSLIIIESVVFYVWRIPFFLHIILYSAIVVCLFWHRTTALDVLRGAYAGLRSLRQWTWSTSTLTVLSISLTALIFTFLRANQIVDAVRSPWDRIPPIFFPIVLLFLCCVGLALMRAYREHRTGLVLFLSILASSPFFLLAWLVYPLGFGFDPFIHQATEKIIAATGTITPKPLYYIGHYTLVTFLSAVTDQTISTIDGLLVPLIASLLLPWLLYRFVRGRGESSTGWSTPLLFLALPFITSGFTYTTPQALANLLFLALVFLRDIPRLPWLLATAILFIHPLTGIASIVLILFSILQRRSTTTLWFIAGTLSFPVAFLLLSWLSPSVSVSFQPQQFFEKISTLVWTGIYRENRFDGLMNLVYFYAFNIRTLYVIVAVLPALYRRSRHVLLLSAASLTTSAFLLYTLFSFEFLISYEQTDYSARIAQLGLLTLLPLFLDSILRAFDRLWLRGAAWRAGSMVALILASLASFFLAYPQHVDGYATSRAYNTSVSDLEAVRWIDADAAGNDYIVLANQAVSAAAIRELGFKKYYADSQFFYPIPTGSLLYQYFLSMVNNSPTIETMRAAGERVGVSRVYFVLNSYWNEFERLRAGANANLRLIHSVNGTVLIYTL